MKCVVCSSTFEGGRCPICQFPVVSYPGDPEEGLRAIKPKIDQCFERFLNQLEVAIVSYHWKDNNGKLSLDYQNALSFGNGTSLLQNTVWLSQSFARVPDQKTLSVTLNLQIGSVLKEKTIIIPNLLEPGLQQIGASIRKSDQHGPMIQLQLRNSSRSVNSEWVALFE